MRWTSNLYTWLRQLLPCNVEDGIEGTWGFSMEENGHIRCSNVYHYHCRDRQGKIYSGWCMVNVMLEVGVYGDLIVSQVYFETATAQRIADRCGLYAKVAQLVNEYLSYPREGDSE